MEKTHAMRVLDARRIPYRALVYDEAAASHSGEEAARLLGVDAASVYKTLVVCRDGATAAKPILVMVPVEAQVDLKRLAREIGAKKLRMATQREAERWTGMRAGGISALALPKPSFDVVIDEHARSLGTVHVSAGRRGVDLAVAVADLVRVTGARFVRAAPPKT